MSCVCHQVTLVRPAPGSWGLRLQGGVDVQKALAIINVTDGSPSEMSGLKVRWIGSILLILGNCQIGDVLLQINGQDCSMMTHKAAQDAIVGSGDRVELLVQRWSAPAPTPQGGKCSLGSSHLLRCLEAWCAAGWGSSNRTCPTGSDLHPDKLDRKPSGRGLPLGREAQHHRQGFYTGRCRAWVSICCSSCE